MRALLAIGGADDVLDELLRHANRNVAEPVIRYAERLGIGVVAGMVHVFVTDAHWKHKTAKQWLARRKQDPALPPALAAHGLALDDVTRKEDS